MKDKKMTFYKPLQSNVLIWVMIMLISFTFCLSSVIAQTIDDLNITDTEKSWNPFGVEKIIKEPITESIVNVSDFMLREVSEYPIIQKSSTIFWIESDKIAEYKITKNTERCGEDCYMTGKAVLYKERNLFDDATFKDLNTGLGKSILSHQYYYRNAKEPTIEKQCIENPRNKSETLCYEIAIEQEPDKWLEYNQEILPAGNYEWMLTGKKNFYDSIDAIPISEVEFNEWANWGAGGTNTTDGAYTVHTFYTSGQFNFTGTMDNVSILVVAGGGGGGGGSSGGGGGGGAGGLIFFNANYTLGVGTYNVTVGAGGAGTSNNTQGMNGLNSFFGNGTSNITATGGGGGGTNPNGAAKNGGSGGGAGAGAAAAIGSGIAGQGNNGGGADNNPAHYGAGGGGGAGTVGSAGTSASGGGNGGYGRNMTINGSTFCFAGGGAGAGYAASGGTIGLGMCGGGNGGLDSAGSNAVANTGSGGGGGQTVSGGNGGSGIVIIRYLTQSDTTSLTSIVSYPANNSNWTSQTMNFGCNFSSSVQNISSVRLNVYNLSGSMKYQNNITGLNTPSYNATWNSVNLASDGSYKYNCTGFGAGGVNGTSETNFFDIDSAAPSITIGFPTATAYNYNVTNMTWTISDAAGHLSNCWVSNSSGAINTSVVCGANITYAFNGTSGTYIWSVSANDTYGNMATSSVAFTVDTTEKGLTASLVSPITGYSTNSNSITFNWTLVPRQVNISNSTLRIWTNAGAEYTTVFNNSYYGSNLTKNYSARIVGIPDNLYKWNVDYCSFNTSTYACSTTSANFTFTVDATAPSINIVYPTSGAKFSISSIQINYTVSDSAISSCYWSNNSGISNNTLTCGTNITSSFTDGPKTVIIYANDTFGNRNQTSVSFTIDTVQPSLYYIPLTDDNNSYLNRTDIRVNISVNEPNIDKTSIFLYNGSNSLVDSSVMSLSDSKTRICYQETANISTDCGGLSTGFYVNTLPTPFINYKNIFDADYSTYAVSSNPPSGSHINITYMKPSWASGAIWSVKTNIGHFNYTLPSDCWDYNSSAILLKLTSGNGAGNTLCYNGSSPAYNNFKLINTSGAYLYEEAIYWTAPSFSKIFTAPSDGIYRFNVTANDTYGNIGFSETYKVTVDTTLPVLNITSPYGAYYSQISSIYNYSLNFTVNEANPSSCWFSTSENMTNLTITSCLNTTVSFALPGSKTVYLYSNDSAGNIGSTSRSFDIILFAYENTTYETKNETFTVTVPSGTQVPSIAKLNYNNINYTGTLLNIAGTYYGTATIDIPTVASSQKNQFYWIITYLSGSPSYSSVYNQTVSPINLTDNCSSTTNVLAMNITAYSESNTTRVNPFKYESTMSYWLGSGAISKNVSFSSQNISEKSLCILPINQTYYVSGIAAYDGIVSGIYTPNTYYFVNNTLTNTTQQLLLTLLSDTESTTFIQKVQDSNLQPYPNVYIITQRYDSGTDTYSTTQITKTGSDGKTLGFYKTETVFYRHIIMSENGTILLTTERQKMRAESVPYTITFTVGATNLDLISDLEYSRTGISFTPYYNKTSKMFTFTYVDISSTFTSIRLNLTQKKYNSADTIICAESSSSTSGILSCNMTAYNSSSFTARTYRIQGGTEKTLNVYTFEIEDIVSTFGNEGLMLAWFIILTASMMFLWDIRAGAWGATVATVFVNIIGLAHFSLLYIFSLIGLSLIFTVVMRSERSF